MFDGLTQWDLSSADKPSVIIPGLATEWAADAKDRTKWIFKLRKGAKFHDGTDVNADAIVFNFEKVLKKDAPHYDARLVGADRAAHADGHRRAQDRRLHGRGADQRAGLVRADQPHQPVHRQPDARGRRPRAGPSSPRRRSARGPWKFVRLVPRERLELEKNAGYWDAKRVPKTDRVVLMPMPDANTRVNALLSGQVDWIEARAGDAVAQLKSRGFQITSNPIRTPGRGSSRSCRSTRPRTSRCARR